MLYLKGKGAEARGCETSDGFVVFAGSKARADETPSIHYYMLDLRKTLIEQGILKPAGDALEFTQDYEFNSPSTAAGVMLGRSANGRVEWKDAGGKPLKELQESGREV